MICNLHSCAFRLKTGLNVNISRRFRNIFKSISITKSAFRYSGPVPDAELQKVCYVEAYRLVMTNG